MPRRAWSLRSPAPSVTRMRDVEALLRRQQGMATRQQLAALGMTRRALERALREDELRREPCGLYRAGEQPRRGLHLLSQGDPDLGYLAELRAVLLTVGGHAAASRRSAAVLWGLDMAVEPQRIEVDVVPTRSRVFRPGVDVRRRRLPDVVDLGVGGTAPVRVISRLRTVLDCAADLPLAEAVVIADSALRRGLPLEDLQRAAALRTSCAAAEQVRQVVRWADARSGSVLESLLRCLLAQHGILVPATQLVVTDAAGVVLGRVDFAWPVQRLIVETDGRRWHDPEDARDRDRRRSNAYAREGWRVLRFTWAEVVHAPESVVAAVRDCLGLPSLAA